MMHEYDCKVALKIFHPEYDVPGVGRMIMASRQAMMEAQKAKEAGDMANTIPPMGTRAYSWMLPITKKVKEVINIPVAVVGKVVSVENGEKILADGDADIICYGRSLLCDPYIPVKVERAEPIRECLQCNKGCVDAIQGRRYISCILNAENCDEGTIFIKPADEKKNVVIVGARNMNLPIPGADGSHVVSSWDVLDDKVEVTGNVAVIGGGLVGAETAEYLAQLLNDRFMRNRDVTVLEMAKEILMSETGAGRSVLVMRMMEKGIHIECNAKVISTTENTITYEQNGKEVTINDADTLIFANGYHIDPTIEDMLKEAHVTYHLIGDGHKVGNIKNAISEGYEVARKK